MDFTPEQMLEMLKRVRLLATISYSDDRTVEEKDRALREILVVTRDIGNDL